MTYDRLSFYQHSRNALRRLYFEKYESRMRAWDEVCDSLFAYTCSKESAAGNRLQVQFWKLNATLLIPSRQIHSWRTHRRYVQNCFPRKRHFSRVGSTLEKYHAKMRNNARRNYGERLHSPRYLSLFNQRRKNVRRGNAVGFVQSAVRMYERTYAYFMFIYIWMCTATCSRRHSRLSNEAHRSVAPDRHFSIPGRNLPSGASSSRSIIFPSDLRYA